MGNRTRWIKALAVLAVGALALGVRMRAVDRLPIDYDEDDYLATAQRYAAALRTGDWRFLGDYNFNYEHPPLTKLVYAFGILPFPPEPLVPERPSTDPPASALPEPLFLVDRVISATLGTLEAGALALLNPLAGLFLAIQTWQVKYNSQIMLESLPALTSALAVLTYAKARAKATRTWSAWLALSGAALGMTAASKYVYCVAGLAILGDWLWTIFPRTEAGSRPNMRSVLARAVAPLLWGLIALGVFFLLDPRLWTQPFERLGQSLSYHFSYAQSQHVAEAGFPFWQPFVWLSGSVSWHPGVFVFSLDLYISLLAVLGFRRLWRRQRVFALWLAASLIFLTLWRTKWPQYLLILNAPLSLAAAEGFAGRIWEPLTDWWRRRRRAREPGKRILTRAGIRTPRDWSNLRRALPWLLPGAATLTLLAGFPLIFQVAMSLTDFNATSIRDGVQGGVWRAVWQGLTGQASSVALGLQDAAIARQVHFAGPGALLQLFGGAGADVLFFNVLWVVLTVCLQSALGIGVALLLHRRGLRFANGWRSILILPWAIPEFVGAMLWLRLFEPRYGWIPEGMPHDIPLPSYLADKTFALFVLVIAAVWYGFPFIMLAASAALKMIPAEVYDAAAIDGAAGWHLFRQVTWPLLLPLVVPATIIRAIFGFNQFYLFYVMRPPMPLTTWATVSFYYFNVLSGRGQFAISAAINTFTVVVLIALVLALNRWTRASEGVTYA